MKVNYWMSPRLVVNNCVNFSVSVLLLINMGKRRIIIFQIMIPDLYIYGKLWFT